MPNTPTPYCTAACSYCGNCVAPGTFDMEEDPTVPLPLSNRMSIAQKIRLAIMRDPDAENVWRRAYAEIGAAFPLDEETR